MKPTQVNVDATYVDIDFRGWVAVFYFPAGSGVACNITFLGRQPEPIEID